MEVRRLLPKHFGEAVPIQPPILSLRIEGVEECSIVERRQVSHFREVMKARTHDNQRAARSVSPIAGSVGHSFPDSRVSAITYSAHKLAQHRSGATRS